MMTRKKFILAGLVLIALASFLMAFVTYLLLSKTISTNAGLLHELIHLVAIPLAFGVLLWKRLRYLGASRKFIACGISGFVATVIIGLYFDPQLFEFISGASPAHLNNEIAAWAKSGGEGDFSFSMLAKLKMASFNATIEVLRNWPLFAALLLGAFEPRFPRKFHPFNRQLMRRKTNHSSSAISAKQILS